MKKLISVLVVLSMLVLCVTPAFAAENGVKDYTISNPYESVDFDSWQGYKTQLHCHTTASDGMLTIKEAIAEYYDFDYDTVAITDHGTTNLGWNVAPQTIPIMRELRKERTGGASTPIVPLTDEEYAAYTNGTAASEKRTHANGLLDVQKGDELNMATPFADCHLTGYWSDYGQGKAGVFGDYETPAAGVKADGGVSMLSHIGEYVYIDKDSEKHAGQPIDEYYVNKFARVFIDNAGSCVGMGINSATDAHTRCDRILYDSILLKTIPNGVTPWGFTFSDSHSYSSINDAYCICYMPENTNEALRTCMTNGTLFGVSHYSNGIELNGMREMENYRDEYALYDDETYWASNQTPVVTKVEVDEENDIIKVWGENFDTITWVSAGNVVLRESGIENGYAELDLHRTDLADELYMFVRFYITGDKGICYSQPFTIYRDGETFAKVDIPETHDISTFLRTFVTIIDWFMFKFNPVIWAFKYFAMGYDPVKQISTSFSNLLTDGTFTT